MAGARSRFNQGVVDAVVDPSTFLPLASPSDSPCLRAPWDACVLVLEVSFSDDRRPFCKTMGGSTECFTPTVPPTRHLGAPRMRSN